MLQPRFSRRGSWRFLSLVWAVALGVQLVAPATVEAQRGQPLTRDPKILKERYERKVALPFMEKTKWVREIDAAQAMSAEKRVPIVAYFTRSFSP